MLFQNTFQHSEIQDPRSDLRPCWFNFAHNLEFQSPADLLRAKPPTSCYFCRKTDLSSKATIYQILAQNCAVGAQNGGYGQPSGRKLNLELSWCWNGSMICICICWECRFMFTSASRWVPVITRRGHHLMRWSITVAFGGKFEQFEHLAALCTSALDLISANQSPRSWSWYFTVVAKRLNCRLYNDCTTIKQIIQRSHSSYLLIFGPGRFQWSLSSANQLTTGLHNHQVIRSSK